jgi:glycosyltransferase involved in cell wall biosynthesis
MSWTSQRDNTDNVTKTLASAGAAQTRPLIKFGLLSSGLGIINRGFELTTARWYEAVRKNKALDTKLYSGGPYPGAWKAFSIKRDYLLNSPLKSFFTTRQRGFWEFCYTIEQISFSICLPDLLTWRPNVVWTKEVPLAHFLLAYKYLFGLKYKIIFANGGAFAPTTYKDFDFIQHLHPDSFDEAEAIGIPASRMQLLPNCVAYKKPSLNKAELRAKYGFTDSDWIVICVAAWNSFQKRLDYLIEEVSAIDEPNVKLFLCGQPELETAALQKLGNERLANRITWSTLQPVEVYEALALADVFVLPSFREGLASSIIEAAMAGIPIISHPHSGGKYILLDDEWMRDLSRTDALKERLLEIRANGVNQEKLAALQKSCVERFSEQALSDQFVAMIEKVAAL